MNFKFKKSISLILTVLMLMSSWVFFPGMLPKASAAVTEKGKVAFYVPEVIYLYPSLTAWRDTTSTPFQYYIENTVNTNSIYSAPTPNTTLRTNGTIYFAADSFSDVSIRTRFMDESGNTLSGGSVSVGGFSTSGSYGTFSVTGGTSPSLAAATTGCFIEWTVSYTNSSNERMSAIAYSYVYKPYTVPYGVAANVENTDGAGGGNKAHAKSISWVSGVHSISGQGSWYPYPRFRATSSGASMAAFLSDNSTGYNGSTALTGTMTQLGSADEFNAGARRMYAVFATTNTSTSYFKAHQTNNTIANENSFDWLAENSANDTYNVPSFTYDRYGAGDNFIYMQTLSGASGNIYIDTSRYTNLNQVPNLGTGLLVTSDKSSDGGRVSWYVADATGQSGLEKYSTTNSDNGNTYYKYKNYVMARQGDSCSGAGSEVEGIKYAGAWVRTLSDTDSLSVAKTYTVKTFYGNENDGEYQTEAAIMHLNATQQNKSTLRAAVNNAINVMSTIGLKEDYGSYYYDTNSAVWQAFKTAYRNAYIGLTKLDGSVSVTDLANALNTAVNNLKAGKNRRILFDVNYDGINPNLYILGTAANGGYGLSTTYNSDESITINGTLTGSNEFGKTAFSPKVGTYTFSSTLISGSMSGNGCVVLDAGDEAGNNVSTRTNFDFTGTAKTNKTFTATTADETDFLRFWVWKNTDNTVYNNFKIKLKVEEGSSATAYSPAARFSTVNGTYGTLPSDLARTGYSFGGWSTTPDGTTAVSQDTSVTSDTLYAIWIPIEYKITYDTNGGAISSADYSTQYTIEDSLVLPSSTKNGYTFNGWKVDSGDGRLGTLVGQVLVANNYGAGFYGNATMIAQWSVNNYTVKFDANTGSGTMADLAMTYDVAKNLTANAFTKSGYTFSGWNTKADGSGTAYVDGASVNNLTTENGGTVILYAQWTLNEGTVTFEFADKTTTSATYDYGTSKNDITVPANTATVKDSDGHTIYTWPAISDVTGDVTYTEIATTGAHTWIVDSTTDADGWKVKTDAVCEATGEKVRTCSVCGYVQSETIPAPGHTLGDYIIDTPATCTTPGSKHKECTVCDYETDPEPIPATGEHKYGSWSVDGNNHKRSCSVCSAVQTEAHDFSVDLQTKTTTSSYHDYKCSVCDARGAVVAGKPINGAGEDCFLDGEFTISPIEGNESAHNKTCKCGRVQAVSHSYGDWVADPENNTDEHGTMKRICSECSYVQTSTCAYEKTTDYVAPTCTENGRQGWACSCGNGYTEILSATGHTFNDIVKANDPTCTEEGNKAYKTCSVCDKYFAADAGDDSKDGQDDASSFVIGALDHAWSVEYNFAEDGSSCTATRVCANDAGHNVTVTAEITSEVTTEPTCTEMGTTTYTATFDVDWAETQTKDVVDVPAKNHAWTVEYSFAEDGKSCTATRVCANDAGHNVTVEATITSEITTPATCTEKGTTTYTATFDVDWADDQITTRVDVAIDADNHDLVSVDAKTPTCTEIGWKAYEYCQREGCDYTTYAELPATGHDFSGDPVSVTANTHSYKCVNIDCKAIGVGVGIPESGQTIACIFTNKYEFKDAQYHTAYCACGNTIEVEHTESTGATCLTPAHCDVCNSDYGDSLGHDWADTTYSFAENGSACTATRVCKRNAEHVETVDAEITSKVTTEPTCTEKGTTTYTATFKEAWAATQTKDVKDVNALDHDWADTTYSFAENGSACTATRVCKRNAEHVETADAEITSEVTTEPTCTEKGTTTYTATFKEAWAATQTKDVKDVDALDHAYDYENGVLTRPVENADGTWSQGYYTYTCKNDASHKDIKYVDRADYDAYETALEKLNELLDTDITDEAKQAINDIIADNTVNNDLIDEEQPTIDKATENLKNAFNDYSDDLKIYTVTFIVDGKEEKVAVISGQSATAPKNPTKKYDETNHYDFEKWDKDFAVVVSDMTVTAIFTGTAHEFNIHTDKDDTYHTDECACGYTKDVKHSYDNGEVTTLPSCTEKGEKTFTCELCGGTRTEEVSETGHKDENKDHACDNDGCTVYQGKHEDADKNHTCDYGCSEAIGTHADSAEDDDHVCDYGCGAVLEECVDNNKDHACDNGCDKVFGDCVDNDSDHDCDYGCDKFFGVCEDTDLDHDCDYGCDKVFGTCEDTDKDHVCDYGCDKVYGTHADSADDDDHVCDYGCGEVLEDCVDTNKDHACDNGCDKVFGTHADSAEDDDHVCDYGCGEVLEECVDNNKDHACDNGCDKVFGDHSDSATDKDHVCDYGCGAVLEECVDNNKDHACDNGCDKVFGDHSDSATDKDHVCDYGCGAVLEDCVDTNKDHACDNGCDKVFGDHSDSATDKDHVCDYGCGAVLEDCVDTNKDHACDNGCDKVFGDHSDSATDKDHVCDYGCGAVLEDCVDNNKDHACDNGCDKVFGTCEDTDYDHVCDYGCDKVYGDCVDNDNDHDCDYGCDKYFGTHADSADDDDHVCDYGCGEVLEDCVDTNKDHACDNGCDKVFGDHSDSATDKDHVCDYGCGAVLEDCVDTNKDHACDNGCDKVFGDHSDSATDKDHVCDYGCGAVLEECVDNNKDHTCDNGCDKVFGDHSDSATDKDHVCDYGCGAVLEDCGDTNKDHACDNGCDKVFGTHADSSEDADHVCDYGCGAVLEDCVDGDDNNHNCDICGKDGVSDHKWVDADCVTAKTCSICGATDGEPNGHTPEAAVEENRQEATCETDGSYDMVVYCAVCDEKLSSTTHTITRTGHDYDEGVITKEPTCSESGEKTFTCQNDAKHTYTVDVPAINHANKVYNAEVASTCIATGTIEHWYCDDCKSYFTDEGCTNKVDDITIAIDSTNHVNTTTYVSVPATCLEGGYESGTFCEDCDTWISGHKEIAPLGHDYDRTVIEPTCTEPGYATKFCKREGCGDSATTPIAPSGHDEVVTKVVASCKEYAHNIVTCKNCDYQSKVYTGSSYAPHSWVIIPGKEATCTSAGYTEYSRCVVCSKLNESTTIPMVSHVDSNGDEKCDTCGGKYLDATKACGCICHKSKKNIIMRILYAIAKFFWKLFRINKSCKCGFVHY